MADKDKSLLNYKGIYAGNDDKEKYTCPHTGAHFEFNDVCGRLGKVVKWRKKHLRNIDLQLLADKGHDGVA